ncbi:hypothetical protein WJX72_001867 [[Myrmecia] bisecta]|uniref:Uncharacterized protein n=1 Tax=[Myrmecia] bisecta TaxID=41462 RepID=A0AAW1R4Q2_9CHLO
MSATSLESGRPIPASEGVWGDRLAVTALRHARNVTSGNPRFRFAVDRPVRGVSKLHVNALPSSDPTRQVGSFMHWFGAGP